ncbi:BTB/POZ domain-containing protein [Heracleum sosnowskyi]|uniref:BTB/POZ domain-containing protein n=1 Tax=Heracleum sosnowskyi TaxID=360622 RepID=A0AAD8HAM6_9APIA|nr:BTB/POZ domain-containing protein [Heracleum sosnowskyi]
MRSMERTDAVIHFRGSCYCVHKEHLASKSNYLKRLLKESSRINISPLLNITPETFQLVVDYCHSGSIVISPVNVAALRIAAELLEMSDVENGGRAGANLWQKTEDYIIQRAIGVNKRFVVIILQSCLSQMPEAETAANLASRCIEGLASMLDEGDNIVNYLQDIKTLHCKDFRLIAESLCKKCKKLTKTAGQDLLYQIVDFYFKEITENLTDEEKLGICNYIECDSLSPELLMHAVRNPRLPLRFVVQALYIERLNSPSTAISDDMKKPQCESPESQTLGVLLQRDAALNQVAQLQSAMDATSWRVQTLEKELKVMRKIVQNNCEVTGDEMNYVRSSSCRNDLERKVIRGQRASISSTSFRRTGKIVCDDARSLGSDHNSTDIKVDQHKKFGRRLVNGLKSAFGVGTSNKKNNGGSKLHRRNSPDYK